MAASETVVRRGDPLATVVCPGCGEGRVVLARSARRVRAGQTSGLCAQCRGRSRVRVTEIERLWARRVFAAMTAEERALVALAFHVDA
jgi:hypothetical protein